MNAELKINRRRAMRVTVTDCAGNVANFETAKDAARALRCTVQHVYFGIRTGRPVSGCRVAAA